jgi:hypothetical protein
VKKILLFTISCITFTGSYGQNELTFPHLENVLQSSYINPAHVPEHKISIGLPVLSSFHVSATNTSFGFNEFVDRNSENQPYLNWTKMLGKLRKENYLYNSVMFDLFSIRVKVRHYYWSFNITEKVISRFSYPKDLMTLALKGNEAFLGSEVNLRNMGLNITHSREFGVGGVKQFSRVIVGLRIKYIQGLANAYCKPNNLGLTTDADYYGMTATANASFNTAGIPDNLNKLDGGFAKSYLSNTKNWGAGMDLGLTYKLSHRFVLSAAVNNIGFINWKSDVKNYNIVGGTTFKGADLGKDLLTHVGDTTDFMQQEGTKYLDSLKNSFHYSETRNAYKTGLIPQFYFTAKYLLGARTQAIGSVYLEKYIVLRPAFTLGLYHEFGRTLNAIVTYSVQYGKFDNVGLGIVIKPPLLPIQIYFAGDNLLNTYTIINNAYVAPLDARNFNLRFGINLVFGSVKSPDKQPYPEK